MKAKKIYSDLMSGVSYFLPFVISGGILMALAYLFDAGNASKTTFGSTTIYAAWLLKIGGIGMS